MINAPMQQRGFLPDTIENQAPSISTHRPIFDEASLNKGASQNLPQQAQAKKATDQPKVPKNFIEPCLLENLVRIVIALAPYARLFD